MLKRLLLVWGCLAGAVAATTALLPSVHVDGGVWGLLGVSALFGLVNAFIGPVLRLVSLPLVLVTFSLFSLVVNATLLALTAGLSDLLDVGGFLSAVVAALLVSVFSSLLGYAAVALFRVPVAVPGSIGATHRAR